MRSVKRSLRGRFWKRVITFVLVWCLIINTSVPTVLALDIGDMIGNNGLVGDGTNGNAAPIWGPDTSIETANGAIIDWNNFNTAGGESVTFDQYDVLGGSLSTTSAVLNRITSASATQFNGALNGNGRVFVVNPAGVIFGVGSTVNVSQLIVSGLNMVNYDDVATTGALPRFEGGGGDVTNKSLATADSVYFVGKNVLNSGSILASSAIVLAAGENVYLTQDGSNILVDVGFNVSAEDYYGADPARDVLNSSLISSPTIVLAAGDTFSRAIHNTGVLTNVGGAVRAKAAVVRNAGYIGVNASPSSGADGGTVQLEGTESVIMNLDYVSNPGEIQANGGTNGNGGNVTLKAGTETTEGTVTMVEGTSIEARGGATSGNGGTVKITSDHFVLDGDIDASPQNPDGANGTLTIDPPAGVTVVDTLNYVLGTPDTLHTGQIETLSTTGTNLIVHADDSITVKDLVDGIIGGRGDIEFITSPDGGIVFEDPSDTISTTRGNIGLSAGAGDIIAGSLETGDPDFVPGQINVKTAQGSGGSIKVENLTVRDGQSSGQINVKADGDLTVNGTVAVGSVNPIDNTVSGGNVEAKVKLESGDDMILNGGVTADAHAIDSGDATSTIQLFVGVDTDSQNHGTYGDLDVQGGDLAATAEADDGTSYALVEVDTYGSIDWNGHQALASADVAHVEGTTTQEDVDDSDKAELIITERGQLLGLKGLPDLADTHMGLPVTVDVLANDDEEATDAALDTGPTHGTVVQNPDGTFTYTPEAGYVGDDSFTYTATDGVETTDPITVTITMNNNVPVPGADSASTHWNQAVGGNVLTNDTDADSDSLNVVLDGTSPTHGTVVLNADGSYTYTPTDTGYVGIDQFTYEVTDGQLDGLGNPVVQTGTVTITFGNNPPNVAPDTATTQMNRAVSGNVLTNDTDTDLDSLSVVLDGTAPSHGTVVLNANGSFTYTPNEGYVGEDTFTYDMTDGQLDELANPVVVTGSVTITVQVGPTPPPLSPVAPGLERKEIEYSGCPALVKWVAKELGTDEGKIDIWMANALASSRDIPPFETYARFRTAAVILRDDSGAYINALAQVINEFASSTAPPTEEQMASIADAIASNAGADNQYGVAEEYLDALAQYISILNTEMGFSINEAVEFAMRNYIDKLPERGRANVAAYLTAKLGEL